MYIHIIRRAESVTLRESVSRVRAPRYITSRRDPSSRKHDEKDRLRLPVCVLCKAYNVPLCIYA